MTALPSQLCPNCGEHLETATPTDGNPDWTPAPDDFFICFGCCAVLIFGAHLKIRPANDIDINLADGKHPGLRRELAQTAGLISEFKRARGVSARAWWGARH